MSSVANDRILLEMSASTLAFRAGQLVEKLLIQRGIEVARDSNSPVVKAEYIRSCIDDFLLQQLRQQLNERDGKESRTVA